MPIVLVLLILLAGLSGAGCTSKDPAKLIDSAKTYLARNDYNSAVIELKNALQAAPNNGEARLLLGRALLGQRDFVAAEEDLWRALRLKQPPEAVLPSLARAMLEQGKFEKLVRDFGYHRKLEDADAQAALSALVGQAFLRLGQIKEAEAAYAASREARPDHAPARLGQAMLAAVGGNRLEAMRITDEVIATSPNAAEAFVLKADLLSAESRPAEARKALEDAVKADGTFLPARKVLVEMLIRDRAFDEAAAQIAAARKSVARDLSLVYLEGALAFEMDDLQKARDSTAQVLKYAPDHVPTLVLAGAVELRSKQFAAGEAHLRKALANAPAHVGARRLLVAAYLQNRQPARALEVLQPLLTTDAIKNPQIMMLAGETFLANGDVKQASAYFSSAADVDAVKGEARVRLGQLAFARGDTQEGFRQLESAADEGAGNLRADLLLIAAHLRRNEADKALAAARALEKRQPDSPLSHFMVGTANLARKDSVAARAHFDKALQLQPTYLPAVSALANLDLADNRREDARRRFEAVIAREPSNEQAYLGLADLQARSGSKPEELAATLRRAAKANPQAVNPWLGLVNLHLRTRNAKAALQVAQEAAAAVPNEPRILGALASAQEAAGDILQSIETLNRLAQLQPQSTQALQQLAGLHLRRNEFDPAIAALRRAQGAAPDDRNILAGLVQTYVRAGNFDAALKEAKALQARQPDYAGGYALEGEVFAAQKKWAEAERAVREALKIEPRAGALAIQLHRVLTTSGKASDAQAFARKWLAENPKDVALRLYLADGALAARNLKAAMTLYQEAVGAEPNNAVGLNNLAVVAGELGDARALDYAQRALRLAPNSPLVLDTLGMLLVNKGDVQKGFGYLEQARALAPESSVLRLNYAKALLKAGRKDEARKELEALRRVPDDFRGKEEIEALMKAS
jgi:putative PEP-CTERM system TPR-repeat lipoprotein